MPDEACVVFDEGCFVGTCEFVLEIAYLHRVFGDREVDVRSRSQHQCWMGVRHRYLCGSRLSTSALSNQNPGGDGEESTRVQEQARDGARPEDAPWRAIGFETGNGIRHTVDCWYGGASCMVGRRCKPGQSSVIDLVRRKGSETRRDRTTGESIRYSERGSYRLRLLM